MKNFKFKWLLLSIILSIASINTAWAVTYNPSGVAQQTMQSQQVMQTGGAYNGTVYEPFSNATPSEASNPAKAPGGPRRGYNPETGEWTPDAPDIETAGDYGQSGESPIGEPWVMALFALAFAGMIAIRQYKRKTVKSINMKNSTSKFIATLALLCTMGVGQIWADSYCEGFGLQFYEDGSNPYYKTNSDIDNGTKLSLGNKTCDLTIAHIYANIKKNGENVCTATWFWYQIYGTTGTSSASPAPTSDSWGGDYHYTHWGTENSSLSRYIELVKNRKPGDYNLQFVIGWNAGGDCKTDRYCKYSNNNYKISWTIPEPTITITGASSLVAGTSTNISASISNYPVGATLTRVDVTGNLSSSLYNTGTGTSVAVNSVTPNASGANGIKVTVTVTYGTAGSKTYDYYYNVSPPAVSNYTITPGGTGYLSSGSGTEGSPYLVTYNGTLTLGLSGATKAYADGNSAAEYSTDGGSNYGTTGTNISKSIGSITSTDNANWHFKARLTNTTTSSLHGAVNEKIVYYKVPTYTVTLDDNGSYIGNGSATATHGRNTLSISTHARRTGYDVSGYYTNDATPVLIATANGNLQASTAYTDGSSKWDVLSSQTLYAHWTAHTYTVTLNAGTGGSGSGTLTVAYDADAKTSMSHNITQTGYHISGWFTSGGTKVLNADGSFAGSTVSGYITGGLWSKAADCTLYAHWDPNGYTVTLDKQTSAEGYSASGTVGNQDVAYNTILPSITGTAPTAQVGYAFMGFFTEPLGEGVKVINANLTWVAPVDGYTNGSSKWVRDDNVTLYAYFEKAQITNIVFSPTTAAGETRVVATPTISPTPEGTTYICWKLFNNAECTHETEGYTFSNAAGDAILNPSGNSNAVSFVTPAFTGSYYVQAILRAGNDCEESTKLDSVVYQYLVASDHTVKVKYMCDGVEIAPLTEVVVPAAGYKGIKALSGNDVFGYQFSSWSLGDGLSNECADPSTCGAAGKDSIYISAVYNGTLTANYTKKNMIFFKDNLGWTDPENASAHVYVNFLNGTWWDSGKGTGNNTLGDRKNKVMNRVPGTTNIFYYEYSLVPTKYISFAQHERDQDAFYDDTSHPAQIVYVTNPTPAGSDMSANYGFDAATPMFVPLDKDTYAGQLWNTSHALYFNRGYWVNYIGEETGYYLDLYDTDGSTLIKSVPFTSEDKLMSMSVTLDLEAAKDYYFKLRRGSSITYGNAGYMKSNNSGTAIGWEFKPDVDNKCKIKTTAAGDYTFLLSYSGNDANPVVHALRIGVTYPSSTGDYRIVYKDLATWSQSSAHTASWYHPSRVITQRANGEDIVSFYISKAVGASASLTLQQVSTIDPSTGAITWTAGTNISSLLSSITESGVYNFKVTQDEDGIATVTYDGAYEGNYYIRTDNAGSSKWSDYIALDHQMTYSEYAQNSGYTHYYMHYCQRGTNVKFCIANDYSPCISDTLIRDITKPFDENMDENGFLYTTPAVAEYADKYSANIRFMWNQNTNKISRAYLSSAQMDNILVLTNNGTTGSVTDENDVDKSGVNIKFKDDQNWIYEAIVKVKPSAGVRLKVFARYSNAGNTATKDQYLIGSYNSGTYDASSSEMLLDGTGSVLQTIRILYDFKTNRLVKAWMPTNEIEGAQTIDADLMIVREHQQSAQNILLTELDKGGGVTEDGSLTTDKKIYAVMRFNRWILSNRANPNDKSDSHAGADYATHHPLLPVGQWLPTYERSLYYISFPFNVKVSEIFGFGNYGTHYAIQRYDGEGRAKNGYWVDSDPNWKWVPPTGTLNAYEGYVLSLSMSNMDAGNTAVWTNKSSEIELYFPSATTGTVTIQNTNVTIGALDDKKYKCTIERDKRNIKDSYWRCIGVPSYADYSGTLSDGKAVINWQKEDIELPFIYEINWQDKSLTPFVGTNFPFKAMHSYLVQYGGEIHWTNVVNKPSAIVARERSAEAEQIFQLELSQDSAYCDRTFVRMTDNEDVTNNFDFNHDLSKETNAGRANIWTMTADSVSAAGNSMPISDQTTIVPVGVKIIADGDYTFALPEGVEGVGVVLIDNIAGTRTNLALTEYTVNLTAGTYDERFYLEISPIAQSPTGIEQTGSDSKDGVRKVMVDGILYIVKDGRIYDATGTRVQ